jgi:hypothetical protein
MDSTYGGFNSGGGLITPSFLNDTKHLPHLKLLKFQLPTGSKTSKLPEF